MAERTATRDGGEDETGPCPPSPRYWVTAKVCVHDYLTGVNAEIAASGHGETARRGVREATENILRAIVDLNAEAADRPVEVPDGSEAG